MRAILNLNPWTVLLIFLFQILVDALYCYYVKAVADGRSFAAATVGASIHFLVVFSIVSYMKSYWYVLPVVAGSWVGTYATLRYKEK